MKRFGTDASGVHYKKTNRITYTNVLNLNHVVKNDTDNKCTDTECDINTLYSHYKHNGPYIYTLKGVVLHRGTLRSGHYIFLDFNQLNNECTSLNDTLVSGPCSDETIQETYGSNERQFDRNIFTAYAFLYEKKNVDKRFLPYQYTRSNYNSLSNYNPPSTTPSENSNSQIELSIPTELHANLSNRQTSQQSTASMCQLDSCQYVSIRFMLICVI